MLIQGRDLIYTIKGKRTEAKQHEPQVQINNLCINRGVNIQWSIIKHDQINLCTEHDQSRRIASILELLE